MQVDFTDPAYGEYDWSQPGVSEYEWLLPGLTSTSGEHIVEICRQIQSSHAMQLVDGVVVDAWTAAAVVKLADSLNVTNRAKFMSRRTMTEMGALAQKVCFRAQNRMK
jgi:hypothetical protein